MNVRPDRQQYQGALPGLHRQERHVSFGTGHRLWNPHGGRDLARQGWPQPPRPAGFRFRRRGQGRHGCRCERDLRAAAGRRRCHLRGDRGRYRLDRVHHGGHSGARHGQGQAGLVGIALAPDRTQLPRRDDGRRVQDRHHAGQHLQAGFGRDRVAFGHPHLRSGVPDHPRRASARPPRSASGATR